VVTGLVDCSALLNITPTYLCNISAFVCLPVCLSVCLEFRLPVLLPSLLFQGALSVCFCPLRVWNKCVDWVFKYATRGAPPLYTPHCHLLKSTTLSPWAIHSLYGHGEWVFWKNTNKLEIKTLGPAGLVQHRGRPASSQIQGLLRLRQVIFTPSSK
jgi:hypothetical protein